MLYVALIRKKRRPESLLTLTYIISLKNKEKLGIKLLISPREKAISPETFISPLICPRYYYKIALTFEIVW